MWTWLIISISSWCSAARALRQGRGLPKARSTGTHAESAVAVRDAARIFR